MSFWKSQLLRNLEDGKLPEVETKVTIEPKSLYLVGGVLLAVAVGIALLVIAVRRNA